MLSIKPVMDARKLWKTKKFETLFPDRFDVFCYNESKDSFLECTIPVSAAPAASNAKRHYKSLTGFFTGEITILLKARRVAIMRQRPFRARGWRNW